MLEEIHRMLVQILRNQLQDMSQVATYSVTHKVPGSHDGYLLRIEQTKALLEEIDPVSPYGVAGE